MFFINKNSTKWYTMAFCVAQSLTLASQRPTHPPRPPAEKGLTLGYHYNFGDPIGGVRPPAFHFLEVGGWKTRTAQGHHPFTTGSYAACDIGLNTHDLVIGPKIGGFFSILIWGAGGEVVYYTDFHGGSLRLIPSLGLFTPYFKLTINPHLVLSNKEFQNLNPGHINLTLRLLRIGRKNPAQPPAF